MEIKIAYYKSQLYNYSIILIRYRLTYSINDRIRRGVDNKVNYDYQQICTVYQRGDTTVYLVYHPNLQKKLIAKKVCKNSDSYFRARMEAIILKTIDHPCIPRIYDVFEDEKTITLIEEFMQGETLYSICQTAHLSFSDILFYSIQLCNILSYLHESAKPVLHLDLNPRNILIDQSKVSLIDFSASSFLLFPSTTSRYGTPPYAAPELYGNQVLDNRTDIYGIGRVMEYMMDSMVKEEKDGRWDKETKAVKKIITRCIKRKKERRYSSLNQVMNQLMKLSMKAESAVRKELIIGVAGSQCHIGTTHVAFGLCRFLKKYNKKCLYEEHSESGDVKFLIRNQRVLGQEGYYTYEGIPVVSGNGRRQEFDATVIDYGVLSNKNAYEYKACNLKLLIYGDKPYEVGRANSLLQQFPDVLIDWGLKNFSGRNKKLQNPEIMCRHSCYEIPFFTKGETSIDSILAVILKPYL